MLFHIPINVTDLIGEGRTVVDFDIQQLSRPSLRLSPSLANLMILIEL